MLRFYSPLFLTGLLLLPLLLVFERKRKRGFVFYSSLALIDQENPRGGRAFLYFPLFLRLTALALLILAIARPQLANVRTEVTSEGVDILLAIDTSGSMQALDFKIGGDEVDRLTVVKQVVADFIKHRISTVSAWSFSGEAVYTQSPLTLDYDMLLSFLNQVQIGAAGMDGDRRRTCVIRKRLKSSVQVESDHSSHRRSYNSGRITPEKAAEIAAAYGIKVYTIGVGTRGAVPFPQQTFFGMRQILVQLDIDEETLQRIAEKTGGKFFRANDTEG
ncbi:MAG: VWA domain-containing protein [bacterium]